MKLQENPLPQVHPHEILMVWRAGRERVGYLLYGPLSIFSFEAQRAAVFT